MFAVVWSVGGCIDTDSRVKFDAFFRELTSGKIEEHPIPTAVGKIDAPIPPEGLVYDYLFEVRANVKAWEAFDWPHFGTEFIREVFLITSLACKQ